MKCYNLFPATNIFRIFGPCPFNHIKKPFLATPEIEDYSVKNEMKQGSASFKIHAVVCRASSPTEVQAILQKYCLYYFFPNSCPPYYFLKSPTNDNTSKDCATDCNRLSEHVGASRHVVPHNWNSVSGTPSKKNCANKE